MLKSASVVSQVLPLMLTLSGCVNSAVVAAPSNFIQNCGETTPKMKGPYWDNGFSKMQHDCQSAFGLLMRLDFLTPYTWHEYIEENHPARYRRCKQLFELITS